MLAQFAEENSNLLIDTLLDWNTQLKNAGVDFKGLHP